MKTLSSAAQAMWDELGEAAEEFFGATGPRDVKDGARRARRYINASHPLFEYIADLEERARCK